MKKSPDSKLNSIEGDWSVGMRFERIVQCWSWETKTRDVFLFLLGPWFHCWSVASIYYQMHRISYVTSALWTVGTESWFMSERTGSSRTVSWARVEPLSVEPFIGWAMRNWAKPCLAYQEKAPNSNMFSNNFYS